MAHSGIMKQREDVVILIVYFASSEARYFLKILIFNEKQIY